MGTFKLKRTERSFTIGHLTQSLGSVKLRKHNNSITIVSGPDTLTFEYDQLIGIDDETFANVDLAEAYLEEKLFKNGGGDGGGVTSSDVSSMVLTTQEAYDALDPKVSTTLYLIPEE